MIRVRSAPLVRRVFQVVNERAFTAEDAESAEKVDDK
jgi:hypothetical protein